MMRIFDPAAVANVLTFVRHDERRRRQRRSVFSRFAGEVGQHLRGVLCAFLVVSLLATSTPAAPQTIVGLAGEWQAGLAFWLRGNGLPAKVHRALTGQNPELRPQERQEEREARVTRLQLYPGDTTIGLDDRVLFAAVAYDSNSAPVAGVRITWSAHDRGGNLAALLSRSGEVEGRVPGVFRITAEAAGKTAQAVVTVLPTPGRPRPNDLPLGPPRRVSTRDSPSLTSAGTATSDGQRSTYLYTEAASRLKAPAPRLIRGRLTQSKAGGSSGARQLRAHALPIPPDDGWGSGNYWSADDPGNRRGDPPGQPLDAGSGSGNFQLAAPVLGLPGRGVDISLGLAYNSRVWNKASPAINFDIDRDWPAPGWSLGFGKMADLGSGGSMMIDADGTRHAFTGYITPYSYGQLFTAHTTDGTFIQYSTWKNASGVMTWAEANLPNGSQIHYYTQGPGGMFPADIIDANGNYINITYVNNTGPRIQTVSDTLGRVISFYYDYNNLLTAITGPGFGSGERTLVRLKYRQISLSYSFSLTPVVRDQNMNPWVMEAIYYPGTNTGYWFGDTDSYSTYGMLAKVIEQRGMGFSAAPLTEQGTVTQGQMTLKEVYNYPMYVGDISGTPSSNLSDAPTYTSCSETWTVDGVTTAQAVTNYDVHQDANPRTVTITMPNGTKSTQKSYNAPGQFIDGLVFYDETRDATNTLLQSSTAEWALGAFDSPRPTRLTAKVEPNPLTATEFSYGDFNQVTEARNYDYIGTTLLRSTRTQYENSPNYTGTRHIFNLPLAVEVYAADNTTRVSRTEYQYDGQTLADTPGVIMHADNHNPYAPSGYNPITDYRGNVTQVTTYADAIGLAGAVSETRRYDINGNMIKASTSCCEQRTISYPIDTQYGYPLSETRGSATDPYAQVKTSATYDFNTGLILSVKNANGRVSQMNYESATLRPSNASLPSGAYADYGYDDTEMTVITTTHLAPSEGGAIAKQNVKNLDGHGQVRREQALGPNSVWDFIDTTYDSMGRVSQESRPYRNGDTLQWSTSTYDALSRIKSVQASDGSAWQAFYNETNRPDGASSAPGETMRTVDAWGRERWGRTDAQGRWVEVAEPNPSGNGSTFEAGALLTTYAYNTLGNLITTTQGVQTRSFRYDSFGRLTAQKLAETAATLNDSGIYVGLGGSGAQWSDFFKYDIRSNLVQRVDARGVRANFWYFNPQGHTDPADGTPPEPLNRLQSVSYDTTADPNHGLAPGDPNYYLRVLDAATVTYQYRTNGGTQLVDLTQLASITTSNVAVEGYSYDFESRIERKSVAVNGRPSMDTDYAYDSLDRIRDVTYPKRELGVPNSPRKVVHHDYDVASRLSSLTVDGQQHASNIVYNAADQTTQLQVGVSGANQITENYGFEQQTGLLASQTVVRGTTPSATTLLDLTYDYVGANGKRTGQLTKLLNNKNHNRDRSYTYDALGRLKQATGGLASAPLWTQAYSYDRYGNRTSVTATGYSAKNRSTSPAGAGILSAKSAQRGRGSSLTESSDPPASLPSGQLASRTDIDLPDSLRTDAPRSISDSSFNLGAKPVLANSALPQGGPPVFTDDPLFPGVTPIKAVHITELRTAVNLARTRAGLPAANWAEAVATNVLIKAAHIVELRSRLDEARAALGLSAASYTDLGLSAGVMVKAVHIQELRQRVTEALAGYSSSIPADGLTTVSYDTTTNRINTAGFQYDAAGNQTRIVQAGGSAQKFQYDAANRLANVRTDANVIIASYTYGDSNERLVADEGGLRTYYVSASGAIIAEYSESGSSTTPMWSKNYVYLGARLLSTFTPNGSGGDSIQYHHPDRLGTRLVTNGQNTTYFEQVSLPFGTALNAESTGSTNRRFTSYDRSSATGLDYAINRHYDPQQGRFTQVDPIGMGAVSLSSPQTLNLYAYCANDPINHLDPSGLFWGKLFKWISKALKWIGIAVIVAVVVMSGPFAPASGTVLAHILGFLVHLGAIIGSAMNFVAGGVILGEGATAASAAILGASGLLQASSGVGALERRRRHRRLERPKIEPITGIIVDVATKAVLAKLTQKQRDQYEKEVKAYNACVDHEWDVFKGKLEEVKATAEKHFKENEVPWGIQLLQALAGAIGGGGSEDPVKSAEDRMKDAVPDIINIMARNAEIKEGTEREEAAREVAITKNCKEASIPK